jgi:hypothetical protein
LHPTVRDQLELAQFLSRPVYIGSINTPDPGTTSISYPFSTWVTVAAIAEKLKYYTMINAVFHLRLDISYNPHYYGLSRACLVRDLTAAQGVFFRLIAFLRSLESFKTTLLVIVFTCLSG